MPKQLFPKLVFLTIFIASSLQLTAQLKEKKFYYGFTAGATFSTLSEVQTTIIRPIFPVDTYETKNVPSTGVTTGMFVYYKFPKSKFAIQPQINFASQGGIFHYEDVEDLMYDIHFNYNYLNLSPLIKFYTVHGLFLTGGPQIGIIINRSALNYSSNQPELGPDLQIQQSLREVLKGNHNTSIIIGGGYDAPFGLSINAHWVYGLSDAVETLANGFYFIENKNVSNSFHITLGYHIPFYK